MVKVKKDKVIKDIPKDLVKHYLSAGWEIVNDEKKEDKKFELKND